MTSMPVYCTEDDVAKAAKKFGGSAGPTGIEVLTLRGWILQKGVPSEKLHIEISKWVELLSNESLPYAFYRSMNNSRVLPADKPPGLKPLTMVQNPTLADMGKRILQFSI